MIVFILKSLYALMATTFSIFIAKDVLKNKFESSANWIISGAIGGIAYFFDTLGIGSFATSTAMLRSFKQVPDSLLPGCLNVACVIPTTLEAFIFLSFVETDYATLIFLVSASMVGSWIGAKIVSRLPENAIRVGIALALFFTASFMILKHLHLLPISTGMDTTGLSGFRLYLAMVGSFFVGSFMTIGVGNFAPMLAMAGLLDMDTKAMFPIMMSVAALGGAVAGIKFISTGKYHRKSTIAMIIISIFGVLGAAYIVKELPMHILNWVVVFIIYYTALTLLYRYWQERNVIRTKKTTEECLLD